MTQDLEAKIRNLPAPMMSVEKKEAIKKSLFENIKLAQEVARVAQETKMQVDKRAMILERLMDLMENGRRRFGFFALPIFKKQFAAVFLVLVLVFSGVSFVNVDTKVVFASELTQLADMNGEVLVQRNGENIEATLGMELYEKDKIVTGEAAMAVVMFFDDSVSRLSPKTTMTIDQLNSKDSVRSYVQIEVESGQVWSKVVNLVEEDSAFVVKGNGLSTRAQKGAFNVEVKNDKVEVGVFNNEVNVSGEKFKDKFKVVTGQKVVAVNKQQVAPKVFSSTPAEKDGEWVKSNLKDDQKYIVEVENRLIAAKMKSVGLTVDETVSLEDSVRENTLKFLTFDDVDKQKMGLDLAEKKFISAQLKLLGKDLTDEEKAEANAAFQDFYAAVKDFYAFVETVATTDKEYAKELRKYAEDKVLQQKKALTVILPDSPYYGAKEVISQIELLGAGGSDLAKIKQNQAQDKLATMEEVINKGDIKLATQVLDDYQQDITDVISILDLGEDVDEEDKQEIVDSVADNSAMLKAINSVNLDVTVTDDEEATVDVGVEDDATVDTDEKEETTTDSTNDSLILDPKLNFDFKLQQNLDFSNLIKDGPFGVQIQGDKPLDPLLKNIH